MTSGRWSRVKEIFAACLEREPSERAAYLDQACGDVPGIREEVESLLAEHEAADSFLDGAPLRDPLLEQQIGVWRITAQIGDGGMGRVYHARRTGGGFEQEGALKVLKRGMDSELILRHFRSERQILAGLMHPGIARLLDGGMTPDGRPYFVMELVEGEPLDEYARERKLGLRQRLQLFLKVCGAVRYAHQHLVVHRDLKPSNILVNKEGEPKLLDFGIAKLLSPDGEAVTLTATRMMTPQYASPEQLMGHAITTSTDVYSLGAVLYSQLTGAPPYGDTDTIHGMAEAVSHKDPERPSTVMRKDRSEGLSRALRRSEAVDLDNIVFKALAKDPAQRYASVDELAGDVRRFLNGEPVLARPQSFPYRAGKFVRRHGWAVAATAVTVGALGVGLAATLWQARIAHQQRARAERRFNDVRKLANSMIFGVHDAIQFLPGATPARQLIVKEALQYLESLSQESSDDPSLQAELAGAYERLADVQGGFRRASLGDSEGALKSYEKALAIRTALSARDPNDAGLSRDVIRTHGKLSDLLLEKGNPAAALEHSRTLLALAESLCAKESASTTDRRILATAYGDLAFKQAGAGEWKAAVDNYHKSLASLEALSAGNPGNKQIQRILSLTYERTALLLLGRAGQPNEARELITRAHRISSDLAAAEPNNADLARLRAYQEMHVGEVQLALRQKAAIDHYRAALKEMERLAAADPRNAQYREDVASMMGMLGDAMAKSGEWEQGLEQMKRGLALLEAFEKPNPGLVAEWQVRIGDAYGRHAAAAGASARALWRSAREWYEKAKDSPKGGEAQRGITRCDGALAALEGRR